MLECWKVGILRLGKLGCWFAGEIPFDMEVEILMNGPIPNNPPKQYGGLKPAFHYSIIPSTKQELVPQEKVFSNKS
jgi:hypothetical protein